MTVKTPRKPRLTWASRRLAVVALSAALAAAPGMAVAQHSSAYEQISGQLQSQGFTITSVEKTWLGRVRIVARSAVYDREVVFVPATGEILRDYWVPRAGAQGTAGGKAGSSGASGGSEDEDFDDGESDDDEDDDEEDDEDNSGPGGGGDEDDEDDEEDNSGSGSSNSGSGSDNSGSGSGSSGSGSGSDDDD